MATPEQTAEALEKSIAHWEENARAERLEDVKTSASDCALCALFRKNSCKGCPVAVRAGMGGCWGSPYIRVAKAETAWSVNDTPKNRDTFRAVAQSEVDFLKSLRQP